MRALIVSHPCVVPENQKVYAAMAAAGWEVRLVTPDGWRHEYSPGVVRTRTLPELSHLLETRRVVAKGSVPLHAYVRPVRRLLARTAPDVVYVEEEPYSVAAWQWTRAAARGGIPAAFYTAQNIAKRYPPPFRVLERAVWERAEAVAITADAEAALRQRGYRGRVHRVPLAVDLDAFSPTGPSVDRAELGLRDRVVGYVGRLVPEKGIADLVAAYRALPGRERTSLLVVGNGPMRDEVAAVPGAVVRDSVRHDEVPRHLRAMDVLCVPSRTTATWREQFGRVVVEAVAAGVPVVSTDSGELPRLAGTLRGVTVVAEGDGAALLDALRRTLDSGRAPDDWMSGRQYSVPSVAAQLAATLAVVAQRR